MASAGSQLKNPYGRRQDGAIVRVSEVPRGLDCQCVCPACGGRLVACKGELKQDYFAHYAGADCHAGYETALHLLAKDILAERKRICLPALRLGPICVVYPNTYFQADSVELERRMGMWIPDVVMKRTGCLLLVEIKVTHGVDKEKETWIKQQDLRAIEWDFSHVDRAISREDLKHALVYGRGPGTARWINHPDMEKAQAEAERQQKEYYAQKR